ncbi:chemotaxis protein CheB [Stenotrophomonas sp. YIM B06876]|uniref:chemotaxis protein CheB n=1 Tax=Stenotrophomonas sp. YIM B06876 TaxID=3060211 RepID=UPI0027396357|nr:chemotaxis protein CheB [Stenotrophomonas sp. YIM B06876]
MFANESEGGTPVALLARPGAARDRLREAVISAGGQVILEDDPAQLAPQTLQDAAPLVVLVALEPAIEDALERLEPVLEAPHLTLIFDEAELAARREGWEAQRWIRHLAAKLHGHDNVLPPGQEVESSLQPEPGMPPTPAELHVDAPLDFHLEEAFDAAPAVPNDALYPVGNESLPPPLPVEPAMDEAAVPAPAAPPPVADFSSWSLVDDEATLAPVAAEKTALPEISSFLSGSLALTELVDDAAPMLRGAVLLLAGIGGPDAVRRLLGALPETFERPVLVQMRLDGGRYGNLVKQMARVTALPVALAEPGQALEPSHVYILPDDVGVSANEGGLRFVADPQGEVVDALPAADSAVVMLSGADPQLVERVLALAGQGGWVAGQIGEGCYDPEAASRLAVAGMSAGDPVTLATTLSERWAA